MKITFARVGGISRSAAFYVDGQLEKTTSTGCSDRPINDVMNIVLAKGRVVTGYCYTIVKRLPDGEWPANESDLDTDGGGIFRHSADNLPKLVAKPSTKPVPRILDVADFGWAALCV